MGLVLIAINATPTIAIRHAKVDERMNRRDALSFHYEEYEPINYSAPKAVVQWP